MNTEKKELAKNLFFQTELTKTQISAVLGISRRSITYWIKEGDWLRLKKSAAHMPSLLAEKCYHIIGHLTDAYLSERRLTDPVTAPEIDALHKLTLTISKLKNRSTINESMELFGFFLEGLQKKDPGLAAQLTPHIEEYIGYRASISPAHLKPDNYTMACRIPWEKEDRTETLLDAREDYFSHPDTIKAYTDANIPLPSDEEITTLPPPPHPPYVNQNQD